MTTYVYSFAALFEYTHLQWVRALTGENLNNASTIHETISYRAYADTNHGGLV